MLPGDSGVGAVVAGCQCVLLCYLLLMAKQHSICVLRVHTLLQVFRRCCTFLFPVLVASLKVFAVSNLSFKALTPRTPTVLTAVCTFALAQLPQCMQRALHSVHARALHCAFRHVAVLHVLLPCLLMGSWVCLLLRDVLTVRAQTTSLASLSASQW